MPKPKRKPRLPTIQPPHPSDKFTLEEAIEAWRRVDEQMARARADAESRDPAESAPGAGDANGPPYPTPDDEVRG
jgi:hypothetical protein